MTTGSIHFAVPGVILLQQMDHNLISSQSPDRPVGEKTYRSHVQLIFNTETEEEFNSWLDGFDSKTKNMTNIVFDFYIHSLVLLYFESVQARIIEREANLSNDFWSATYQPE